VESPGESGPGKPPCRGAHPIPGNKEYRMVNGYLVATILLP